MFGKSRGSIANANASTANTNSVNVSQNGASVSAIQQDWNDREFIEVRDVNNLHKDLTSLISCDRLSN